MQNTDIWNFIINFDLVWILEAKKYYSLSVPGFSVYRNDSKVGQKRGGVVLLLRSYLNQYIKKLT